MDARGRAEISGSLEITYQDLDALVPIEGHRRDLEPSVRRMAGVGLALLVGDSPNRATVGRPHLWLAPDSSGVPHTANTLADWGATSSLRFRQVFDRTNVVTTHAPRWPAADARRRAEFIRRDVERYPRPVVLLGRRVATAFGLRGELAEPYRWSLWKRAPAAQGGKWYAHPRSWSIPNAGPLDEAFLLQALDGGHAGWVPIVYARHPSKRSLVWNRPGMVEEAREFWSGTCAVLAAEARRRACATSSPSSRPS